MTHTFYIVDQDTYDSTNWQISPCLNFFPLKIGGGEYAGNYVISKDGMGYNPENEIHRELLESMPTAQCDEDDLDEWFPPPPEE